MLSKWSRFRICLLYTSTADGRDLMPETVFITGGSRGIGAACVRAFAAAGWNVAFTFREQRELAGMLAEQTGALALSADLSDSRAVSRAVGEAQGHFGALDAVVCLSLIHI